MNSIDKNKINNETSNKSGIQGSRIVLPENYVPTDICLLYTSPSPRD